MVTKQDVIEFYNEFYNTLSKLDIKPIQTSIQLYLEDDRSFSLNSIEEFKNEILSKDKIKTLFLSVICGIDNTVASISLNIFLEPSISVSSYDKAWVDEQTIRFKKIIEEKYNTNTTVTKKEKLTHKDKIDIIIGIIGLLISLIKDLFFRK